MTFTFLKLCCQVSKVTYLIGYMQLSGFEVLKIVLNDTVYHDNACHILERILFSRVYTMELHLSTVVVLLLPTCNYLSRNMLNNLKIRVFYSINSCCIILFYSTHKYYTVGTRNYLELSKDVLQHVIITEKQLQCNLLDT